MGDLILFISLLQLLGCACQWRALPLTPSTAVLSLARLSQVLLSGPAGKTERIPAEYVI